MASRTPQLITTNSKLLKAQKSRDTVVIARGCLYPSLTSLLRVYRGAKQQTESRRKGRGKGRGAVGRGEKGFLSGTLEALCMEQGALVWNRCPLACYLSSVKGR